MQKAVYSAVLTPFKKDLTIDTKLFIFIFSYCFIMPSTLPNKSNPFYGGDLQCLYW